MTRPLLNFLTVLSLLLCVAVVVLWARGLMATDLLIVGRFSMRDSTAVNRALYVENQGGAVLLTFRDQRDVLNGSEAARMHVFDGKFSVDFARSGPTPPAWDYLRSRGWWGRLGFDFATVRQRGGPGADRQTRLPHWALLLLFAALPAWWTGRQYRLRRRTAAGLCPSCGYDLRATPGKCPECGTAASVSTAE